jgi:hypothetical protein
MTRSHLAGLCTLLAVAVGLTLTAGACGVEALDLNGHACPCGPGFVCDSARDVCVALSEITVDASVTEAAAEPCLGDSCACVAKGDCKDPAYPECIDSKCVQCTSAPADSCGIGSYCLPTHECAPGCKSNAECATLSPSAPFCNTGRHQCVNCAVDTDCTGGLKCSPAGACVSACTGTCTGGKTCCNGLCLDTKSDPLNCNACGAACGGAASSCCAGTCTDVLTTKTNCGQCGTSCSTTNGSPYCQGGSCKWNCSSGFNHCGQGNTGCETNTSSSVTQCGSCYKNCNNSVNHATGVACVASSCTYATCVAPYLDCDTQRSNGCECTSLTCGSKGQLCCAGNVCNSGLDCEPAPGGDGKCHD